MLVTAAARRVDFASSCAPAVKPALNDGLALLYAFEYQTARAAFDGVIAADFQCCIAYFFAASSFSTPIWAYISDGDLARAHAYSVNATACALSAPAVTAREAAYIAALAQYANTSASLTPTARLQLYADALNATVYTPYAPTDEHASILYGLALLGVGYYSETEPADGWPHLLEAARLEEAVLAPGRNPEAPGALHYVVHAYDQPSLAVRALGAARRFAAVAAEPIATLGGAVPT